MEDTNTLTNEQCVLSIAQIRKIVQVLYGNSPAFLRIAVKCANAVEFSQVTALCGYEWIQPSAVINLNTSDCIGLTVKSREIESWFLISGYVVFPAAEFIKANKHLLPPSPALMPAPVSGDAEQPKNKYTAGGIYLLEYVPLSKNWHNKNVRHIEISQVTKTSYKFRVLKNTADCKESDYSWMLISEFEEENPLIEILYEPSK
jgi:hypothetical protein